MDTKRSLLIFGDSVGKKEGSQSTINNNVIKLSCDNLKARELEDYEDYENHLANLDKLAKLANLDYLSRYDAGIVDYLCEGDIKQLELEIDYGYVKLSTVEKIKEILGLNNIKINGVRSKEGIKYEKTHDILINMGLCTACASNAAEQYVKKPNTNCAKLVKKALAGEKSAFNQLDSDRNICQ